MLLYLIKTVNRDFTVFDLFLCVLTGRGYICMTKCYILSEMTDKMPKVAKKPYIKFIYPLYNTICKWYNTFMLHNSGGEYSIAAK